MAKEKRAGKCCKGCCGRNSGSRCSYRSPGHQACCDKPCHGSQSNRKSSRKFILSKKVERNNFTPINERRLLESRHAVLGWSEPIGALYHFTSCSGVLAIDLIEEPWTSTSPKVNRYQHDKRKNPGARNAIEGLDN